jgi:hypothetical protein
VSVDFALAGEAISIASFKMFVTRFFNFFSASRSLRLAVRSSDSLGEVMTTAIFGVRRVHIGSFFCCCLSEYAETRGDLRTTGIQVFEGVGFGRNGFSCEGRPEERCERGNALRLCSSA